MQLFSSWCFSRIVGGRMRMHTFTLDNDSATNFDSIARCSMSKLKFSSYAQKPLEKQRKTRILFLLISAYTLRFFMLLDIAKYSECGVYIIAADTLEFPSS